MSSAMHGAASFKSLAPILSVPVALLISIFDKYFKTFSFSTAGTANFVSWEILLLQKSFVMIWRVNGLFDFRCYINKDAIKCICNWAPPSEFVSSSIPSWQTLTAHAQPFRGARDLAFCLKVPLDSLLVWASSEGSGETARMRRLAWTFAARIGDKYQIRLAWPNFRWIFSNLYFHQYWQMIFQTAFNCLCQLLLLEIVCIHFLGCLCLLQ